MNDTITGTLHYISPEMFNKYNNGDQELNLNSEKSDIFSVGLTILRIGGFNVNNLNSSEQLLNDTLKNFEKKFGS